MPKMKTHRGAAKRFRKTASGKFRRNKANHRHILTKKTKKMKRRSRGTAIVASVDEGRLNKMLPYA
ncbi:MAG: 50S ribosomal protein L35 [Myxococcales bacterium]|nr:50S ribosomal protein L35 [Myxococcales bacterium]